MLEDFRRLPWLLRYFQYAYISMAIVAFTYGFNQIFTAEKYVRPGRMGTKLDTTLMENALEPGKIIDFSRDDDDFVTMVHVFSTTDNASKAEIPVLKRIIKRHKFPIYGAVLPEDRDNVQAWVEKYGNFYEGIGVLPEVMVRKLRMGTMPETFLISNNGNVRYNGRGGLNEHTFVEEIRSKFYEKRRRPDDERADEEA